MTYIHYAAALRNNCNLCAGEARLQARQFCRWDNARITQDLTSQRATTRPRPPPGRFQKSGQNIEIEQAIFQLFFAVDGIIENTQIFCNVRILFACCSVDTVAISTGWPPRRAGD